MSFDDFQSMKTLRNWPILLLRVYTGVFFAYYGFKKIAGGSFTDGMTGFLSSRAEDSVGWYRVIVEAVIVPMQGLFAFLVAYGELALGMALIIGLATRYAAFAGAFMVLNFWLAKGQGVLDSQNHDVIWFVILIVLGGLHAGRVLSVDQTLVKRFRFLA
jgi:thiosulfate dehydrogenase [quinone] large subunit